MKTSAPLTPEQIRAVMTDHKAIQQRRRYLRIRTIVRILFWGGLLIGLLWLFGAHDFWANDYRETCIELHRKCKGL